MPVVDGINATIQIRCFDLTTPIVSMTSNPKSQEIVSYVTSGTKLLAISLFWGRRYNQA